MITGAELRHLALHAALASAGVHLLHLGDIAHGVLGVVCFGAQVLVEWVLRDARRQARLAALDEFDAELREVADSVMREWMRRRQEERPVLVHSELPPRGKGDCH